MHGALQSGVVLYQFTQMVPVALSVHQIFVILLVGIVEHVDPPWTTRLQRKKLMLNILYIVFSFRDNIYSTCLKKITKLEVMFYFVRLRSL